MLVQAAIFVVVYFVLWFTAAQILKNASIIDIGWGLGFVLLAVFCFVQNITISNTVITSMVAIWGLRLSYHIFRRNFRKPEDFRYANFRRDWGKTYYIRSFFQLFMLQALLMFMIAFGYVLAIELGKISNLPLFIIGALVWLFGFVFEAVSDYQMKRFKSDKRNKGKLIDTGLWRYSRHPNYFGEAVLWWGIFMIALSCGAPWFTVLSPVTITVLVRYVSGVPLLEAGLKKRDGFEEYVATTSIFIPWFRKKV